MAGQCPGLVEGQRIQLHRGVRHQPPPRSAGVTATSRAAEDYLKQRALPDLLTALSKPLLVIFGKEDRRWRSSSAAEYRAIPGARVELLPGVGHSPMLEIHQRPPHSSSPSSVPCSATGSETVQRVCLACSVRQAALPDEQGHRSS